MVSRPLSIFPKDGHPNSSTYMVETEIKPLVWGFHNHRVHSNNYYLVLQFLRGPSLVRFHHQSSKDNPNTSLKYIVGARVAQSACAWPWCIRSRVWSPDFTSLFRLLFIHFSLKVALNTLKTEHWWERGGGSNMSSPSASWESTLYESKGTPTLNNVYLYLYLTKCGQDIGIWKLMPICTFSFTLSFR